MMDMDMHIHTWFSPCAEPVMSFQAILEAADAAGMKEVGLTDHPFRRGLKEHHDALAEFRDSARTFRARIWIGAELEAPGPGRLILSAADLPAADYFLAAPSHYDLERDPPVQNLSDPAEWADRLMTDVENVADSGADAVAHPFFVMALQTGGDPRMELPFLSEVLHEMRPRRLDWMLDRLAEDRIALEISPRLTYLPLFEQFMAGLYRKARARGIRFLLGSDSHRLPTIGRYASLLSFIRSVGVQPSDFWRPEADRRVAGPK